MEERTLVKALSDRDETTIDIIVVNSLNSDAYGESFIQRNSLAPMANTAIVDKSAVTPPLRARFTAAHELGHILMNKTGHRSDPWLLMWQTWTGIDPDDETVDKPKRLDDAECAGARFKLSPFDDVQIQIESVEFTSDFEDPVSGNNLLKRSVEGTSASDHGEGTFEMVGEAYQNPEWTSSGRNFPICHIRSILGEASHLSVALKVKVEPIGLTYKIFSDMNDDYLDFESQEIISTGTTQTIHITTKGIDKIVPETVAHVKKNIIWEFQFLKPADITVFPIKIKTGGDEGHEIFFTYGKPDETCSRNTEITREYDWRAVDDKSGKIVGVLDEYKYFSLNNALTYKRIKLLCSSYSKEGIANGLSDSDAIAAAFYQWIMEEAEIKGGGNSALEGGNKTWALLDKTVKGECVPQAFLMEMALKLLGLKAEYRQVRATSILPVIEVNALGELIVDDPKRDIEGRLKDGYPEFLFMDFNGKRNWGEACCVVNGKYYPAYVGKEHWPYFVTNSALDLLKKMEQRGFMVQRWYRAKTNEINPIYFETTDDVQEIP